MEYTKLGNTGLEVSKLCLGCMSFGDASLGFNSGWLLDEEKSRVIIKKALDWELIISMSFTFTVGITIRRLKKPCLH
ncbi:aldo/keto reductase [Streptococcus equinus]|nr:aldo/keto reductase [Streptococcus equinus]VTS87642.1 aldo/keto reductase [Streptococcus equinus]